MIAAKHLPRLRHQLISAELSRAVLKNDFSFGSGTWQQEAKRQKQSTADKRPENIDNDDDDDDDDDDDNDDDNDDDDESRPRKLIFDSS